MRKKRIVQNGFLCLIFIFMSCTTVPKFKGRGDLCGLVVDENNEPVKDFLIYCKNDFEVNTTALTNETGMFVVHDVPAGTYTISGKKKNFVKLESMPFLYSDRERIFCCKVESIDGAFKTVEQLIMRGEKKSAEKLLDNLYCDKKTPQQAAILVYRFFLTDKTKEKKKIVSDLKKMGQDGDVVYSDFANSLEELIDEKK